MMNSIRKNNAMLDRKLPQICLLHYTVPGYMLIMENNYNIIIMEVVNDNLRVG